MHGRAGILCKPNLSPLAPAASRHVPTAAVFEQQWWQKRWAASHMLPRLVLLAVRADTGGGEAEWSREALRDWLGRGRVGSAGAPTGLGRCDVSAGAESGLRALCAAARGGGGGDYTLRVGVECALGCGRDEACAGARRVRVRPEAEAGAGSTGAEFCLGGGAAALGGAETGEGEWGEAEWGGWQAAVVRAHAIVSVKRGGQWVEARVTLAARHSVPASELEGIVDLEAVRDGWSCWEPAEQHGSSAVEAAEDADADTIKAFEVDTQVMCVCVDSA